MVSYIRCVDERGEEAVPLDPMRFRPAAGDVIRWTGKEWVVLDGPAVHERRDFPAGPACTLVLTVKERA